MESQYFSLISIFSFISTLVISNFGINTLLSHLFCCSRSHTHYWCLYTRVYMCNSHSTWHFVRPWRRRWRSNLKCVNPHLIIMPTAKGNTNTARIKAPWKIEQPISWQLFSLISSRQPMGISLRWRWPGRDSCLCFHTLCNPNTHFALCSAQAEIKCSHKLSALFNFFFLAVRNLHRVKYWSFSSPADVDYRSWMALEVAQEWMYWTSEEWL